LRTPCSNGLLFLSMTNPFNFILKTSQSID